MQSITMDDDTDTMCWHACLACLTSTWRLVRTMVCCHCRSLAHLVCSEVECDPRTRPRTTTTRIVTVRFRNKEHGTTVQRDLIEPHRVLSRAWIEGIVEEMERGRTSSNARPLTERVDS